MGSRFLGHPVLASGRLHAGLHDRTGPYRPRLQEEFTKRNVKPIALSVDDADSHRSWIKAIDETQQTAIAYPIIADKDRKVAQLFALAIRAIRSDAHEGRASAMPAQVSAFQ